MPAFSRAGPASARAPCTACCQATQAGDDDLAAASATRIVALGGGRRRPADARAALPAAGASGGPVTVDCGARARQLGPLLARFQRYRQALPSARAAADMNELGDAAGDEASTKPCLTRLPVRAGPLNAALGLPPGTLQETDLRNDVTGFRAALYRDEGSGRLILVPRDTEPDSLVDWQANIGNGLGIDGPQYKAMRQLASTLASNDRRFDVAGYSKGGGLAQQAGLVAGLAEVRLFNSAGVPDQMLGWTGRSDFDGLVARTTAFSAEGDLVTFMNTTTDPGQAILNARFLQRELAGDGAGPHPIAIQVRNPALRGAPDAGFAADKKHYMDELVRHIDDMQTAYDTGAPVASLPPVRAASSETLPGSMTLAGQLLGAGGGQPTLGKLAQHRMGVVLEALERTIDDDRRRLHDFVRHCG